MKFKIALTGSAEEASGRPSSRCAWASLRPGSCAIREKAWENTTENIWAIKALSVSDPLLTSTLTAKVMHRTSFSPSRRFSCGICKFVNTPRVSNHLAFDRVTATCRSSSAPRAVGLHPHFDRVVTIAGRQAEFIWSRWTYKWTDPNLRRCCDYYDPSDVVRIQGMTSDRGTPQF